MFQKSNIRDWKGDWETEIIFYGLSEEKVKQIHLKYLLKQAQKVLSLVCEIQW